MRVIIVTAYDAVAYFIVFRLVRDVVANHKTTRYAGAATKVIQKKSPCLSIIIKLAPKFL